MKLIKYLVNLLLITPSNTTVKNLYSNKSCMFGHEFTILSKSSRVDTRWTMIIETA
jgi:hypothetical protein